MGSLFLWHKFTRHTHLQCVFVVLGVQHGRHRCQGDARFNLRGHQGVGQLGVEESYFRVENWTPVLRQELEYFHNIFLFLMATAFYTPYVIVSFLHAEVCTNHLFPKVLILFFIRPVPSYQKSWGGIHSTPYEFRLHESSLWCLLTSGRM